MWIAIVASYVAVFAGGVYVGGNAKASKIAAEIQAFETSAVSEVKAIIAAIKKHI